jgi:hypothetical protein
MPATASASVEGHPHRRTLRNMSKDAKSKQKKTKSGKTLPTEETPQTPRELGYELGQQLATRFRSEVDITTTVYAALTNAALGERLRKLANDPKGWKGYEKQLMWLEAARRLDPHPEDYNPPPYRELTDAEEAAEEKTWD